MRHWGMSSDLAGAEEPDTRAKAERDLERMLESEIALLDDLEHHVVVTRQILEGVRRRDDLDEVLARARSGEWRRRLTDSLTAFERNRHRARLRLIALGTEKGMTLTEVQEHWAITRQLAQRALRDIDELD
jgi:hypothetical protein